MKMIRLVGVIIVLFFAFAGSASSQEEAKDVQQEEVKDTQAEEAGNTAELSEVVETAPGNVTMDFKDADINNVLRILSYKSGMNIVSGKDVTGLVTIRLTNVPWEKALDVILRTYGYTYEREGNIIRVTTTANLENEELMTEVFFS
jgi:type IV pilus assembly protein PilQ